MKQSSIKKNTVFNTIKTISSIIFPLITFSYITRTLLPENVGKINFGLSIVSYYSLIASLGVSTYAIRECSKYREDKEKLSTIASQIFSINILSTIIAYILLGITLVFYTKIEGYRTLIIIQSFSIVCSTIGADWLNSAMEDFKYITIRTVVFQIISLLLMLLFIHRPEDYLKYAVISLVSSSGAQICNIWYRKRYARIRFTPNTNWKTHLGPILLLFVMILSQTIFNNLDMTMLGLYVGDREVGIYSAAHKVMNIINQLVASLLWVIMPRLSLYFTTKDYAKINGLLRKVLAFYFFFGLPSAVGCICISKDIILVISGSEYADAASVLQILMIGFLFMLIGGDFLGNAILLPAKGEKLFMIACLISTIVNAISNYFLIPRFGAIAAAATTAFSELIILVILFIKRDRRIKIDSLSRIIISPLMGCIAITATCLAFRSIQIIWARFVLSVGVSVGVYFLINLFMKNEVLFEIIDTGMKRIRNR